MKATGFSGVAHVMGRDRQIRFEGETLQVAGLSLEEATQVVSLLERVPNRPMVSQPEANRTQTQPATTGRRVEPPAPEQKVEPTPAPKVETKVETKPKVEPKPETKKPETKSAPKAEPKPKQEAKPETKRQVVAPEPSASIDDDGDVDYDPETGEVRSTPEEIEQEAREEREAIQAADAEEEEAPPPKSKQNGKANGAVAADDDIPDDVKKARHLRSVIGYLVETKGFEDADAIVAWCKANADAIPTVKRIGDKLEDRVTRALQIMSN